MPALFVLLVLLVAALKKLKIPLEEMALLEGT